MLFAGTTGDVTTNNNRTSTSNQRTFISPMFTKLSFHSFNNRSFNNITNRFYDIHHQQQSQDVTDNKTTDNSTTPPAIYEYYHPETKIMNENLCSESERLRTFSSWPLEFLDKNILARTGMFYTGDEDKVKCYFCSVEIGRWEPSDNALSEHIRWSPNCPLIRRRTTNNAPIDTEALDCLLPPISFDICGANDVIEVRPAAYAEGSISAVPQSNQSSQTTTPSSNGSQHGLPNGTTNNFLYPEHSEYAIESARIRSYSEWPRHMKQKPVQLSEAGFFYTGIGDRVKCFSCGGGLKDWDDSDDPWEQHALWLGQCRYLKLIKGISFIEGVKEKFNNGPSPTKNNDMQQAKDDDEQQTSKLNNISNNSNTSKAVTLTARTECNNQFQQNKLENTLGEHIHSNINNNDNNKKIQHDDKLCKICYVDEYNTAFLPCGHVVACAKCASSVTKCPMCRKPFTDVMRVYFS